MQDLELYSEKIIIEPGYTNQAKVLLIGIDLDEIKGQVNMDKLFDLYDYDEISDYLQRRKEEDAE